MTDLPSARAAAEVAVPGVLAVTRLAVRDFRALTKGKIAILISHRFSTVRMADQIVVLQEGRIVERGSHAELVRANGHYARLFELQARGYQ